MVTLLIPKMKVISNECLLCFATPVNLYFEERNCYFYQSTVTSDSISSKFCSSPGTYLVLKILSPDKTKPLSWLVDMKFSYFLCCSVAGDDFVKHETA